MFDNYDIQDALSKANDALNLFEKKSKSAIDDAIQRLNELLWINSSRNHLYKFYIEFHAIHNLGKLYQYQYDTYGNEGDLAYGIFFYERAERLMGEFHPDRPSILNNLGNLLYEKFISDRNPLYLEMAINNCKKAEEFYQKTLAFESINRNNRYIILNGLGNVLRERYAATGSKNNLNDAIDIYKMALALSPDNAPIRSIILNNLAIGLRDRFDQDNNLADLNEAIEAWYEALRLTKDPKYIPSIFSNLGEGLKYRYIFYYEHSQKELAIQDLNEAIFFSQKAVESSSNKLIDKAMYLGNLGNQLSELHGFLRDSSKQKEASDALDKAIAVFEDVINLLPRESRDVIGSHSNLGRALRDKYNLSGNVSFLLRSFHAYKKANKSLNSAFFNASISYKIGVRKRLGDIDDMLIETALKLRELAADDSGIDGIQELNWGREAMVYAEGCKSSILTELLGRRDMSVPSSIPSNLISREEKLLKGLNEIDLLELSRFGGPIITNEISNVMSTKLRKREELSKELGELWNQIELSGPGSKEYIALRRGDRPSWEDLKNLIKNPSTALLSLFPLAKETVLFILREDWDEPTIIEIPIGGEAQLDIWRRFRREVHLYDSVGQLKETWDRDLIQLLKEASNYLEGIDQVIFSPGRFGCLLPWEALLQKAGVNVYLTTIPNLKIWSLIDKSPVNTGSALVIGNPMGGDDLIHAEEEAQQIAKLFGTKALIGAKATKEAILRCLPEANIAHFATHAYFSLKNPLDSGIILADGVLTIREIIDLNIHLKLLVLSACETGMNSSLGGDEMAGFAQGFILAGARSMLVSLWKVDDQSTGALMAFFYNKWINRNANNAEALSYAMAEIRNRENWKNIYFWGAFTLVGDISKYK